ncbi:MAG: FliM/FliN family flagellar motor C-terminal domain-containing protein [Hyphomonadaceae bacterium]|nr:FliM/FliN family flagellar motor C-terminal domain-containing protein [Hyphomonadaceae bacterium]
MVNPEMAEAGTDDMDSVLVERRDPSPENTYRRTIFSVPVTVTVSLGKVRLSVSEILDLKPEAVVPLTSGIEDPVDLTVDNKIIARGELVETENGGLGVKITEIPEEVGGDPA